MNNRERAMTVLNYDKYDAIPVVHFGYWRELINQWYSEGKLTSDEYNGYGNRNNVEKIVSDKLGFDFGWSPSVGANNLLMPHFEHKVLEERADGFIKYQNGNGLIEVKRAGAGSIPKGEGTLLTGRVAWEELYLPKLKPSRARVASDEELKKISARMDEITDRTVGYSCGSLYGSVRDMLGVEELSYLSADDPDLYCEIINTVADICYDNLKTVLESGIHFDYIHYWEDICFKNGPLVSPEIFSTLVGPHYKRMTDLAAHYGIKIVSLDCDGCIDKLLPIWLENGVNTMFPIEVGTWEASIEPWRRQYGKELRGVGGMDKRVFAQDRAAVDKEIERLYRLTRLGGYIPCPDHRIPLGSDWDLIKYYCEKLRERLSN